MKFHIHEDNMPKLEKRMKHFENKAKKQGINFCFEILGEDFLPIQVENRQEPEMRRFFIVEVESERIVKDWEFVASIAHTEGGNLINLFDKASETEVEIYRDSPATCDHCNSNRRRKETFIVRNTITKELKRVGRSCLSDFIGTTNAEDYASYLSFFNELAEYDKISSFSARKYHTLKLVVACSVVDMQKRGGYFTADAKFSTIDQVACILAMNGGNPIIPEEAFQEAQKTIDWAKNMEINEDTNSYLKNLQVLACSEYQTTGLGLVVSMYHAYRNHLQWKAEQERRQTAHLQAIETAEWYGTPGERVDMENAEVKLAFSYSTQWGYCYIYNINWNGYPFVWKTSRMIEPGIHSIRGTIKEHDTYKDVKQTILTRCKVLGED